MVGTAVIPVAGLGTRLLPMTKEMPKEMLPIFLRSVNGKPCLKPMVQAVYEMLYDVGFRDFGFIVGRGKRVIEDHFTPDREFIGVLKRSGKADLAEELRNFYRMIDDSTIVFINQPEPRGFGDAVLKAKPFINEVFLVHAGDTYIISEGQSHLQRLLGKHAELKADATLIVQEVEDPRIYGVIEGREIGEGVYRVERAVEKPDRPATNLAIMPVYVFDPVIFKALEATPPGKGGEVQLTDGIQRLIDWGLRVNAVKLRSEEVRLDIGHPESCWEALSLSYQNLRGSGK
ncbi:MAG: UTP--glucose-1-phosphate uridylyltransferase [Candidatus Geothermarchaeales archaeon]